MLVESHVFFISHPCVRAKWNSRESDLGSDCFAFNNPMFSRSNWHILSILITRSLAASPGGWGDNVTGDHW